MLEFKKGWRPADVWLILAHPHLTWGILGIRRYQYRRRKMVEWQVDSGI